MLSTVEYIKVACGGIIDEEGVGGAIGGYLLKGGGEGVPGERGGGQE